MEFFKKSSFFEKVSRFRFQRALNHPQTLSLSQVMQENVILAYYAQIWKFGPGSQKWNFSKKVHFFEKVSRLCFQRALNHPQTLGLSQVMQENVIMPKYGNSAPGSQKWNFSKKVHLFEKVSRLCFQRALNHPQTLGLSQVMQENVIMPKYGNSAPGSQKWNFSKKVHLFEKVSRFRFQRALNHPQTLSLSQVMQENVVLAYYAQIWKFGPRLPKMEFFKKFSFFRKGLQISLLTSSQPPADIKFKSSYARKHIIKKVESRTQLLNPEWRSYQSFT